MNEFLVVDDGDTLLNINKIISVTKNVSYNDYLVKMVNDEQRHITGEEYIHLLKAIEKK